MSQGLRRACPWIGVVLSALLASCSQESRGPTTPSAVVVSTPSFSWACVRQSATASGGSGWTFPAADDGCAPSTSAPEAGVGAVSVAPGNLRSTVTGTTVRLDWNAILEPVTSYLVEAGSAPTLANLARLDTRSAAPALVVNNVPSGAYYVRVRAVGPDGIPGPASNEIVVQVGPPGSSPQAPANLAAQVANNQVTLSWSAPAGGLPPGNYVIEAGSASSLSNVVVFETANANTQLTATAPNGQYFVRVRAKNSGGVSPPSNEIVVNVPGNSDPQGACTYTVSPQTVSINTAGGNFEISVAITGGDPSRCRWAAESNSSFLTLLSPRTATGPGTARFSIPANDTGRARTGSLRISFLDTNGYVDIDVNQPITTTACSYSVSPTSASVSNTTGTFSVAVSTGAGCSWSATASGFATVVSGGQSGSGTARFSVSDNPAQTIRSTTVRISWPDGGQEIAVQQDRRPPDPPTPTPPVESQAMVDPPQGGSTTPVPAPPPQTCVSTRGAAACIQLPQTGSVTSSGIEVGSSGLTTFLVQSGNGQPFDALIVTNAPAFSGGTPSASTHLVVTFPSPRTSATLSVNALTSSGTSLQIALTRDAQPPVNYVSAFVPPTPGVPCTFTVSPTSVSVAAAATTAPVNVSVSPAGCSPSSWTASSGASFVTVSPATGNGSGTATLTFLANTSAQRTGTVTIAGRTVSVTQAPPAVACNAQQVSGADTPETRMINLGRTSGTFQFSFDTVSQPDRMVVSYEGATLFDTGCVGASGVRSLTYSGTSTVVTVQVTPNCNGGSGTAWSFTVSCPQ